MESINAGIVEMQLARILIAFAPSPIRLPTHARPQPNPNHPPSTAPKQGVEKVLLLGARACGDAQQTGIDPDTGLRA